MKIGIMQPYFFPYIGYWQLFNAVDCYVIYDDVNYIKGGWINRNNILLEGKAHRINLHLSRTGSYKKINEIQLGDELANKKVLTTLEHAYKRAPYYENVYPIIESIISFKADNVALYNGNLLKTIGEYLGIDTKVHYSSELNKNQQLTGQDRVIDICRLLDGDMYVNAIGGRSLYDGATFANYGIALRFLKCEPIVYTQFGNEFVPNLSIIDVLMFNSLDDVKEMLTRYKFKE